MKLFASAALGVIAVAALAGLAGGERSPAGAATAGQDQSASATAAPTSPYPQRPLFGDTHLHTANSFDAFTAGLRLSPEDALRFSRGRRDENQDALAPGHPSAEDHHRAPAGQPSR